MLNINNIDDREQMKKYYRVSDIIKNLLIKLEKEEDILLSYGFNHFAISGHTEGKRFAPWQMFDKSRYTS